MKKKLFIIGGGMGGISAGLYLSKSDFEIHIFESNSTLGGRANLINLDGFIFDTGPSLLNYPWVFEDLFNFVGSSMKSELKLQKIDPAIKYYWPDGETFQLSSDLSKLSQECMRLDPRDGIGLLNFLADARKKYRISFENLVTQNTQSPLKWFLSAGIQNIFKLGLFRSMESQLKLHFKNKKIIEAFGSYGMYLGGAPHDLPGIFSILPFGELEYGLWLPKGGMYKLIESLEKLLLKQGIIIHKNTKVKNIIREENYVKGITVNNDEQLYCDTIISNVDLPTTMDKLIKDKKFKSPKMTPGVMTYYLGINKKLNNLQHHSVFFPHNTKLGYEEIMKNNNIPEDLPFYISVASNNDESLAPKNKSGVFILIPVPLKNDEFSWEEVSEKLLNKVLLRLKQHEININTKDIIKKEIITPKKWKDLFGLNQGSAFGASHNLFQVGPFRNSNRSKKYRNLFFVGASTTPGTGLPMCVLSGKMVSERVLKNNEK
ncbi:MAG: phytoene desaturase family protein [Dehalococcoidia bacterium]